MPVSLDASSSSSTCEDMQTSVGAYLLPRWAYMPRAASVADAIMDLEGPDEFVNFRRGGLQDFVAGPAIPLAFLANALLWSAYLCAPSFFRGSVGCPERGFADYSIWALIPYGFVVLALLAIEFHVFQYTIYPQVLMVKKFEVLGVQLSFRFWFFLVTSLSLASHSDIATNSLSLAKTLQTDRCNPNMERLWRTTVAESVLQNIPFFGTLKFSSWVLFGWLAMLLQVLSALAAAIKIKERNHGPPFHATFDYEIKEPQESSTNYTTLMVASQWHGKAIQALAESSRMASVTFLDFELTLRLATNFQWSASSLYEEMIRSTFRFCVFVLLEAALQPNLQATALALAKALHVIEAGASVGASAIDGQALISILLSVVLGFYNLVVETCKMFRLWHLVQLAPEKDSVRYGGQIGPGRLRNAKCRSIAVLVVYLCAAICTFGLLSYASLKTFMAACVCNFGLWNLLSGCVDPTSS